MTVFVFGSNEGGIHGAGAAKVAREYLGAQTGLGYGHYGDCFAIPTKSSAFKTLPTDVIQDYVRGFLAYARGRPSIKFQVTRIGCGLAGLSDNDVAPLFQEAPKNCFFDEAWQPILGDDFHYWGTYKKGPTEVEP